MSVVAVLLVDCDVDCDEDCDERLLCGTVEYVFVDSVTVEWMVTVTTEINTPI